MFEPDSTPAISIDELRAAWGDADPGSFVGGMWAILNPIAAAQQELEALFNEREKLKTSTRPPLDLAQQVAAHDLAIRERLDELALLSASPAMKQVVRARQAARIL